MLLYMCFVFEHEPRGSLVGACALADLPIVRKDQDQKTCTTQPHVCQCAGDQDSRELCRRAGNVHQDTGCEVVEHGCDGGGRGVLCALASGTASEAARIKYHTR